MFLLVVSIASAQSYQIDWYVIASGGGHSESINYGIDGTVGQPITGESSSDNYIVEAGFWVGISPPPPDCDYIPGDSDGNDVARELTDVVAMIAYYRGEIPEYSCDCPNHPDYRPHADADGNCTSFELTDVVKSIAAYRGPEPLAGCPDCPGTGRFLAGDNRPLVTPALKTRVVKKAMSASQ